MLEEALQRLRATQEMCEQTGVAGVALVAAIEEAILSADFAAERNQEAAATSRIAYNLRGGMVTNGESVVSAHEQIRQVLRDVRSLLGSARAKAEMISVLAQGQVDATSQYIGKIT